MRVAALDCGTNSLRLLVADVKPGRPAVALERRMEVVRLGQGVDRTGELAAEALERAFATCRRYAEVLEKLRPERVRMVATSAMRDARNRDAFVDGVRAVLGVEPDVISGAEEAELSFAGATRDLERSEAYPAPYLVIDIGGGSTELVLGGSSIAAARSLDIGAVRLHERHLHEDPPDNGSIQQARADVLAALDQAASGIPWGEARTAVAVAGSATTVAAAVLGLPAYDRDAIHLARLAAADVHAAAAALLAMTREQRLALPYLHPGRADVIGAGALVLATLVDRMALDELLISEHDILDGIAWSLARA